MKLHNIFLCLFSLSLFFSSCSKENKNNSEATDNNSVFPKKITVPEWGMDIEFIYTNSRLSEIRNYESGVDITKLFYGANDKLTKFVTSVGSPYERSHYLDQSGKEIIYYQVDSNGVASDSTIFTLDGNGAIVHIQEDYSILKFNYQRNNLVQYIEPSDSGTISYNSSLSPYSSFDATMQAFLYDTEFGEGALVPYVFSQNCPSEASWSDGYSYKWENVDVNANDYPTEILISEFTPTTTVKFTVYIEY